MYPRLPIAIAVAAALSTALPAHADGTAAAQYLSGTLSGDVSGTDIGMQLRLPMTRADSSTADKQNVAPADLVAMLKEADKVFTFPEGAACVADYTNAFVVDGQGRPTKGDGNIQAMYRFNCPGAAKSPVTGFSVKLFENLPGLDKLKVRVSTGTGDVSAELTGAPGDVKF